MEVEELEKLADSIRAIGMIEPIVVIQRGQRFEVVAGHRRYLAAKMAGHVKVPVKFLRDTNNSPHIIKIHENIIRDDVNAVDEGRFYREVMILEGWSLERLSREVRRSPQYCSVRIALLDYPEHFQEAVRYGRLSLGAARELAEVDDPGYRDHLFRYACDSGATIMQVRAWVADYKARKATSPTPQMPDLSSIGPIQPAKIVLTCFGCNDEKESDALRSVWICLSCLAIISRSDNPVS